MNIVLTRVFERKLKKVAKQFKLALDEEVRGLRKDPEIGVLKKGDLGGVRVKKFKYKGQEYLLAYEVLGEILLLLTVGSHENFYRDLSKSR